jgi:hypothetical protein
MYIYKYVSSGSTGPTAHTKSTGHCATPYRHLPPPVAKPRAPSPPAFPPPAGALRAPVPGRSPAVGPAETQLETTSLEKVSNSGTRSSLDSRARRSLPVPWAPKARDIPVLQRSQEEMVDCQWRRAARISRKSRGVRYHVQGILNGAHDSRSAETEWRVLESCSWRRRAVV